MIEPSSEALTCSLSIRVSSTDRLILAQAAEEQNFSSLSAFLRSAAFKTAEGTSLDGVSTRSPGWIWTFADIAAAERLTAQVRRIGTLLNQQVRALNTLAQRESGSVAAAKMAELEKVVGQVENVHRELNIFIKRVKADTPHRRDRRKEVGG